MTRSHNRSRRAFVELSSVMPIGNAAAAVAARKRRSKKARVLSTVSTGKAQASAGKDQNCDDDLHAMAVTGNDFLAKLEAAEGRDQERLTNRTSSDCATPPSSERYTSAVSRQSNDTKQLWDTPRALTTVLRAVAPPLP